MDKITLYREFRNELDKICVPEILKCETTKYIMCDGRKVGILCTRDDEWGKYIDCVYIIPEYRRKGLAKSAVMEWYRKHRGKNVRLHIINQNKGAYKFWTSLFDLEELEWNFVDALYRIKGVRQ